MGTGETSGLSYTQCSCGEGQPSTMSCKSLQRLHCSSASQRRKARHSSEVRRRVRVHWSAVKLNCKCLQSKSIQWVNQFHFNNTGVTVHQWHNVTNTIKTWGFFSFTLFLPRFPACFFPHISGPAALIQTAPVSSLFSWCRLGGILLPLLPFQNPKISRGLNCVPDGRRKLSDKLAATVISQTIWRLTYSASKFTLMSPSTNMFINPSNKKIKTFRLNNRSHLAWTKILSENTEVAS